MNGKPVIAYAGMTHLGLCSAIGAASKGFSVTGYTPDQALADALAMGRFPVNEPGLADYAADHGDRLNFTTDPAALGLADVLFVAPDVPTDDRGQSDLTALESLLEQVLSHARPDAVVVILSQVAPGFTRRYHRQGRHLHYQVETLIFGRAIERATQPERFIVGSADPGAALPEAYETFLKAFSCPILPMGYESAELCKIAINCCLVASIGVANTLAELCEGIGADWSEIAPALKLDRRIGPHAYLAPGLGLAGGNLERDLATVCRMADRHGTDAGIVRAWIDNSRYRKDWVLRTLHERVLPDLDEPRLAVLGLAYKENTHSTKNAPSLALLEALRPFFVTVFDPVVPATASPWPVHGAATALEACDGADAVMVMTPWAEFRSIDLPALARRMRGRVVIDPYRVFDPAGVRDAGLAHMTLGVSPASPTA